MARTRLDLALVERGIVETRSKARDLILRGFVEVGDAPATRPAAMVGDDDDIRVRGGAGDDVARSAEKLEHGLEAFAVSVEDAVALDVGASTGGFTQVLLRRGARRVYAVDVGRGQLHPSLREDARVVVLEETDARLLDASVVPESIDLLVADVSFISLRAALPAAMSLVELGGRLVALVKPQFEAGRDAVGKGGIVRDAADRQAAVDAVRDWLNAQAGWEVTGMVESPITGKRGNVEYLIGAVRNG